MKNIRKRLVARTKEGKKLKRKTYYDEERNLYVKQWNYFDLDLYTRVTSLVPIVYPDMLIDYDYTNNSMKMMFKPIQGTLLTADITQWHIDLYKEVYQWLCNDLDRTWPIVHGDWSPSNMIVNSNGYFLIDYDDIYDAKKLLQSNISKQRGQLKFHKWRPEVRMDMTDEEYKEIVKKDIRSHIKRGVPYLT